MCSGAFVDGSLRGCIEPGRFGELAGGNVTSVAELLMQFVFRAVQERSSEGVSASAVRQDGTAGNASLRRCDVGNQWNERYSNGGQASVRPRVPQLDVFDIGGGTGESHREAGLGSDSQSSSEIVRGGVQ